MVFIRSLLANIQCLNRAFLVQCEAWQYSEETRNLQQDIYTALLEWSNNQESISEHRLLWLQLKLYESGILLLHHETDHSSLFSRGGDYQDTVNVDYALAFFREGFELAYVVHGTMQHMSTLAALTQIGLALKQKRRNYDALWALTHALHISCQLENTGDDAADDLNFSPCKSGVLRTLGDIQYEIGNLSQAYVLYEHAIAYSKLDGLYEERFESLTELLEVTGRLSQRLHGLNSKNAARYLKLAHSLNEENGAEMWPSKGLEESLMYCNINESVWNVRLPLGHTREGFLTGTSVYDAGVTEKTLQPQGDHDEDASGSL